MPTGYTYGVANGQMTSFREFALTCAHAFGACVTLGEDGIDAAIPEAVVPDPYHRVEVDRLWARLAVVRALTPVECEAEASKIRTKAQENHARYAAERRSENDRLEAMAVQVRAWVPPTADHDDLRNFMLDQIRISKNGPEYGTDALPRRTAEEWRAAEIAQIEKSVAYHENADDEELDRVARRNAWLRALWRSLPAAATSAAP